VQSLRLSAIVGSIALALGLGTNSAHALGVPAGTDINNTAEVTYTVGTVSTTATSNLVTVRVAEILDVDVTVQTPTVSVAPSATGRVLRYRVTNTGNGPETFRLVMSNAIGSDQFDPVAASPSIYLDSATTGPTAGVFDGTDVPYVAGSNDPALDPTTNPFVIVFVVNNIPAAVTDGQFGISSLTADARTGTGAPGFVYTNQGALGTDAVVGNSGADDTDQGQYEVAGVTVTANKTQLVVDQFGTANPIPGARINYQIVVSATGAGSAVSSVFTDNIPANTTYVPGTLRLNSTVLTDIADVDAGAYESTPTARVSVQLGTLTQAGGNQTIQFAVVIN
jgi:uncharacterized repeat protein (TIGR01451 family)